MIIDCQCGAQYNNETVSACPLCNFKNSRKQYQKQSEERRKDQALKGQIVAFKRSDNKEKRKGFSGFKNY